MSLHTLFVREHNRIATNVSAQHPKWSDEQVFQETRKHVIGELQAVTYNEFLPTLLGTNPLPAYTGYKPNTNPAITTEFSTAGFRFGHSMLDGQIGRLNNDGTSIPAGPLTLKDTFFNTSAFNPALPNHTGDIDPFLKSAASGNTQEVDTKIVDDLQNFLFGQPGQGGLDLAALNIQRGRDHGLADYNTTRAAYNLPKVTSFKEITPDPVVQKQLQATYGTVDNIDVWVGGLAEQHAPGASVGPLFKRIIADQFLRLRDGDRYYYQNVFTGDQLTRIGSTHLSDIIRRNTYLTTVQPNVFVWRGTSTS